MWRHVLSQKKGVETAPRVEQNKAETAPLVEKTKRRRPHFELKIVFPPHFELKMVFPHLSLDRRRICEPELKKKVLKMVFSSPQPGSESDL